MDPMSQPPHSAGEPRPGLPPVMPPSGRFIAQLFLVPGLIVLAIVVVLLTIWYFFTTSPTPDTFLVGLDNPNLDVRWRRAADLSQVLKRTEPQSMRLKTDPLFALGLAERAKIAFEDLVKSEAELASNIKTLPDNEQKAAWNKLRSQRDYLLFLASAASDFYVPVGVPILCEIAKRTDSPDTKGNLLQRRQAVWALVLIGERIKGFGKLPAEQQASILAGLKQEASEGGAYRARCAKTALHFLAPSEASGDGVVQVDAVLADCAKSDDRYLRLQVALALNFWNGPRTEPALLKLAQDDGFGSWYRELGQ